jgi:methionyl-tRNA formyltransferase
MRVVFAGTPTFAVPTLEALLDAGHEILAVVAQPDRPVGRGLRETAPATVELARRRGISIFQPKALKSGPFPERWASFRADVGVVVAYGRILPAAMLAAPVFGCLNVHASLLPRYRGAAPIQWAVARGETQTGVTVMRMSEGLDEGDILLQRSTAIGPEESASELASRLARIGAQTLVEALDRLSDLVPVPQDPTLATFAPPLTREDGLVDWSSSAWEISCRVRGFSPWPGAWTRLRDLPLRIHRARVLEEWQACEVPSGAVVETRPKLVVAAGSGAVELLEVQLPCRKAQSGADLVSGARLRVGDCLGGPCP